jgi:hypothetical protein
MVALKSWSFGEIGGWDHVCILGFYGNGISATQMATELRFKYTKWQHNVIWWDLTNHYMGGINIGNLIAIRCLGGNNLELWVSTFPIKELLRFSQPTHDRLIHSPRNSIRVNWWFYWKFTKYGVLRTKISGYNWYMIVDWWLVQGGISQKFGMREGSEHWSNGQ